MKAKILAFLFLAIISCQSSTSIYAYAPQHKDFLKLLSPKIHSPFIHHRVLISRWFKPVGVGYEH